MQKLEIYEHLEENYKPMVECGAWLVAFLNYAERFDPDFKDAYLERHLKTDEVFVLLSGKATLVVGEELTQYKMEPNKLYTIRKGVWHAIFTSKDAQVLVIENSDTTKENSEYKPTKFNIKL